MKFKQKEFIPALRYKWLTRVYDPIVHYTMPEDAFRDALIAQSGIGAHARVLDFGCGTLSLSLLAKTAQPSANIHAVDVDEQVLKLADEKRLHAGLEIDIRQYQGRILPYPDNTFDRVISGLVFHHLGREQKLNSLFEIFRVLKPGGELHIADWGKAKNNLMRVAFYAVQLLDGFSTTSDHVRGLLPEYVARAGFSDVTVTKEFQTIFGTLALLRSRKPEAGMAP